MFSCPFAKNTHPSGVDRNPSFFVNRVEGFYYCYSCKVTGSARSLNRTLRESGLPEVEFDVSKITKGVKPKKKELDDTSLVSFFEETKPLSEEGLNYLQSRGIVDKSVIESMVLRERDKGVCFPYLEKRDGRLAVVGYSTRIYDPAAKIRFKASATNTKDFLLGYHMALKGAPTIVVEGHFALLKLAQALKPVIWRQVINIVSLSSSSITDSQLGKLEALESSIYWLLDPDHAGVAGTKKVMKRSRGVFRQRDLQCFVNKDVDNFTSGDVFDIITLITTNRTT